MMFRGARQRQAVFVDAIRSRLWPVPAIGVVAAVLLGVALPQLDMAVDKSMPPTLAAYLFGGGADGAREVLAAIATSLMTVTSLTFSLTLVTLQLASSQYSPRLLRTFASDRFVQRTLALFLATFAFALTVLRTVRNADDGSAAFVPRISVTAAYLLATASVLGLVLFLAHLVRQIRIETMLDHVSTDAIDTVCRTAAPMDEDSPASPPPRLRGHRIVANSSGFLTQVDEAALVAAAVDADAVVFVDRPVGSSVVANVPVAFCRPADAAAQLDDDSLTSLRTRVAAALHAGVERTATQDVGYGLRQLTDVAIRALSPGINDPTTAVHALQSCTAVLCEAAGQRLGQRILRDEDGVVRVVVARPDLPDLLDMVCTQPQIYGERDPLVMASLLTLLRDLAWVARQSEHRQAIAERCQRLRLGIASQQFGSSERSALETLADQVDEALDR
ncbi:DUF2254 domain-containing protein [Mycolicibacterium aichiense]|uniref:DUF2254 domain-containing protein n=1 Tax=Mycolicibacterium aichiense TaxID=1799 RepID=A0AAD1MCY8_9MYCO|nr:DUF2254 domain-containing protein [Mycolicibacterium aichiense]MCV7016228.1 DUF2254 domain-containing protein [Mycolicibacterium aichiense]BBX10007.1 hypothetical protein MAIC_48100 [Mycolicibacterium aichiense]STZ26329.1 Conserved membrane protein of uncharacterised function [Mycolicibacterium aichiense]